MKKLLIVLSIFCVQELVLNAQHAITVFAENGERFWLILDGRKINMDASYRIENVPVNAEGTRAKVIFEDSSLPPIDQNLMVYSEDCNPCAVTYMIKQGNKGKYRLAVSTWQANTGSAPKANVQAQQQTQPASPAPQKQPVQQTNSTTEQVNANVNVGMSETSFNMSVQVNDGMEETDMNVNMAIPGGMANMQTSSNTTVTTTTTGYSETISDPYYDVPQHEPTKSAAPAPAPKRSYVSGYSGRIGCDMPMSAADLENVKKSISSKTFEEDKMTVSKQILRSKCVSVAQVRAIMKLFTYEDSKIEFAKAAYSRVHDIDNYYMVNDEFTYSSSIDELNEFIESND